MTKGLSALVHASIVTAVLLLISIYFIVENSKIPKNILRADILAEIANIEVQREDVGRDIDVRYTFTLKNRTMNTSWFVECQNDCVNTYYADRLPESKSSYMIDAEPQMPCITREDGGVTSVICKIRDNLYRLRYMNM